MRHAEKTHARIQLHAEEGQAAEKLSSTHRKGPPCTGVIVDCVRTAVGKARAGTLRNTRPDDLAAAVIPALLDKHVRHSEGGN